MPLTLADLTRAWARKDAEFVHAVVQLAASPDPELPTPIRAEALTFDRFIRIILSPEFRQKSPEAQRAYRVAQLAQIESAKAEVPLSERRKLHQLLLALAGEESAYARQVLLEIIAQVPLVYGPWRALKQLYKQAEAQSDYALLGAIAARCDAIGSGQHEMSQATLIYLRRRAWRYLRTLGRTLPACYPEAAAQCLAAYPDTTEWHSTWIANHIWHHHSRKYDRTQFHYRGTSTLKHRAFASAWQRNPEPLLHLALRAKAERVREYACVALTQDFKVALRNLEAHWIRKLAQVQSEAVDSLVIWLLQNAPRWEQQQFRALGLHEAVLMLLTSAHVDARRYAVQYAQTYARDLSLTALLRLAHYPLPELVPLVRQLLGERDPRTGVGLEAWGTLLDQPLYQPFAATALLQHFGRQELNAAWFQARLVRADGAGCAFAREHLLELHPLKTLGVTYFAEVLTQLTHQRSQSREVLKFACQQLEQLELSALPPEFMQRALCHPFLRPAVIPWLESGTYPLNQLPITFYQALAYEPDWDVLLQQLRQTEARWASTLCFDTGLAHRVREWLGDVRRFKPADLGFAWLMQLVNREEPEYHDFAVTLLSKAFRPADFAPTEAQSPTASATPSTQAVDLEQKSFLFTGKLKTLVRAEAEALVTRAHGKVAGGVNAKLDYLVIGDEGSPLYGHGRKGSKQIKAEELIAAGAKTQIISETAFLQRLAGQTPAAATQDMTLAGCEMLWSWAVAQPGTPVSQFALHYLRQHHPELCLKLTDRPVDPGAEIPQEFLSFTRFKPLFQHKEASLRQFALTLARYELSRWAPEVAELLALSESRYGEVREFVHEALTATPEASNRRYRLAVETWPPADVYRFCESKQAPTRQLGMMLLAQYPALQRPDALFALSESADRTLRSFVLRVLWQHYRHRTITPGWKPRLPPMAQLGRNDPAKRAAALAALGQGAPERPADYPASLSALQDLLRRWLYELPPGPTGQARLEGQRKPWAASAAKQALIETFRDLGVEDAAFAQLIYPLLAEFRLSRSRSEQSACRVALTRLQHAHPQLAGV